MGEQRSRGHLHLECAGTQVTTVEERDQAHRENSLYVKLSDTSPNSVKVPRKVSPGATGTAPDMEPDRTT